MTTLSNFNAAVLLVAMAGIGACARGSVVAPCKIGDMTASFDLESSKMLGKFLGPWVRHVRECHVGEYVIDTPAEGGHGEIMVGRNGNPVFFSADGTTTVIDSSGKRIVFEEATQGDRGFGPPHISYAAHDRVSDTWVENFDLGADGTLDWRTTETAAGTKRLEFNVQQRWLELVQRGDRKGVVLDGEFMTAQEAREKLAARTK